MVAGVSSALRLWLARSKPVAAPDRKPSLLRFSALALCLLSGCATESAVIGRAGGTPSRYTKAPHDAEYSLWTYAFLGKQDLVCTFPLQQGDVIYQTPIQQQETDKFDVANSAHWLIAMSALASFEVTGTTNRSPGQLP